MTKIAVLMGSDSDAEALKPCGEVLKTFGVPYTTRVLSAEMVPYTHDRTYDILPASDSGTYVAGGALIGSTLRVPGVE